MAAHPVPPGTPIQLPTREKVQAVKKKPGRKRRELPPEEQIAQLRTSNRWLSILLIVALLAFAFTAALLLRTLDEPPMETASKGQNYTIVHPNGR